MKPNPRPLARRQFQVDCRVVALALVFIWSVAPRVARAQGSRAAAIVLFDEAERLLEAGHVDEACKKFGESHRLDPQLGALLHYADCEERTGKLATAYAAFRDAAELASSRSDSRAPLARSRAETLEPRLIRIVFELAQATVPDMRVALDGTILAEAALGTALPLDPGEHRIRVTATGYNPWSTTLDLRTEGHTERVVVPALLPLSSPAAPGEATSTRVWSYAAFGLGAVALGAGVGFTFTALSKANEHDALCPEGVDCAPGTNQQLRQLETEIDANRNLGIAAFIGGAALATLGVIIWPDADSATQVSQSLAITSLDFAPRSHDAGARLVIGGTF